MGTLPHTESTMMSNTISITMIEDVANIRDSVSKFISFHEEFRVEEVFDSVESYLHYLSTHPNFRVDILLLDIGLPGMSGIEGIPLILEKMPDLDIIMLTTYDEEEKIFEALQSGACSYQRLSIIF